ncbi:MAG: MFS transporter, partial [Candidatus Heimdallarchaeaceae archaeon]
SMVNRIVPLEKRGKMMGYYNSAFYLSWGLGGTMITGPIADALINQNYGVSFSYEITFYVAAFLVLIGLLIYLFKRPNDFKLLSEVTSANK